MKAMKEYFLHAALGLGEGWSLVEIGSKGFAADLLTCFGIDGLQSAPELQQTPPSLPQILAFRFFFFYIIFFSFPTGCLNITKLTTRGFLSSCFALMNSNHLVFALISSMKYRYKWKWVFVKCLLFLTCAFVNQYLKALWAGKNF